MLVGEPDPEPWPDATPLLGLLAGAWAAVERLRLLNGRFVLKVELGSNAALQILVPVARLTPTALSMGYTRGLTDLAKEQIVNNHERLMPHVPDASRVPVRRHCRSGSAAAAYRGARTPHARAGERR